jgi:hypothetical protein
MNARQITIDEIQHGKHLKHMPFAGMQVTLTNGDRAYISRIIRSQNAADQYLVGILDPEEEFDAEKFLNTLQPERPTMTKEIKNRNETQKAYNEARKQALELAKMIESSIIDQPATPLQAWASVGSMQHLVSQLTEIKDSLYGTGEYAEPSE